MMTKSVLSVKPGGAYIALYLTLKLLTDVLTAEVL